MKGKQPATQGERLVEAIDFARKYIREHGLDIAGIIDVLPYLKAEVEQIDYVIKLLEWYQKPRKGRLPEMPERFRKRTP